jgi:hypothetical protein
MLWSNFLEKRSRSVANGRTLIVYYTYSARLAFILRKEKFAKFNKKQIVKIVKINVKIKPFEYLQAKL